MNFSLILFLLVCATGALWVMDHWFWSRKRARGTGKQPRGATSGSHQEPIVVEYAKAFFPVILVVFLLRSFVVEPFRIPSGSMLPSLLVGDFILVNKFAYGVQLPIVHVELFDTGTPRRGDVAVFRFPGDPSINYIKRVIGLPGDTIVYKGKRLYINGEPVHYTREGPYSFNHVENQTTPVIRYVEDLADARHAILLTDGPEHGSTEFQVPPGEYFVMGDNRDRSNDSRYWGYVPDGNLVGKAFLVWFSWDAFKNEAWPWERVIWHRIGTRIH